MNHGKRIVVVMPAYNAEKRLEAVLREIPFEFVDEVILVDDASQDRTAELSRELGIRTTVHLQNLGYGANQKACYRAALAAGADVIMLYDTVLGSHILCGGALRGDMPQYKYMANRFLTLVQNLLIRTVCSQLSSSLGKPRYRGV